ncbi:lytic transglycosylase domain-containing protein [Segeticoccus rhizosphaerae]|uniref:lytic transglycosylase domain-containing protein n=1 Tax=Segeticoccus rhizosphaerae TaxID=1104777 RepID=UPI0012654382|nr:hypothetical protein [Segeticoccus rhizosphaerae]
MVRQLSTTVLEGTAPTDIPSSALGIPGTVLAAYHQAADETARTDPTCGVPWWLLAGIGRIESGHASGGRVDSHGNTLGRILGPRLDGSMAGNAVIHDSDGGAFDGDPHYDRAVGPMQFLPGTWAGVRADGNGDGIADPNNVYDATLGAARYLCSGGADLRTPSGLASAVLRYNHSMDYVRSVLGWGQAYRDGDVAPVGAAPGRVPAAVNPRQVPDEPPQNPQRTGRKSRPAPSTSPAPKQDSPPVLADGPRRQADSDQPPAPPASSEPTPTPSSTVAPTKAPSKQGSTKTGSDEPAGGDKPSGDPGGDPTGTTKPPSTDTTTPSPSTDSPTTPPTTTSTPTDPPSGTPTDPPTTQDPTPVQPGQAWSIDAPTTYQPTSSGELATPAGTVTVTHQALEAGATVERGGEPATPADGARLWIVSVQFSGDAAPEAHTSIRVGDGEPVSVPATGTQYLAVTVPAGVEVSRALVVLTVTSDDGSWSIDAGTGGTATAWAHTGDAPADVQVVTAASAMKDGYTAELHGLRLGQAHRASWEPGYGTAEDGTQWLVVPYTLDSATLGPDGYAQSRWAPGGVIATVNGTACVAQVPAGQDGPLGAGSGALVFRVPAGMTTAQVRIAPQVSVVEDGSTVSEAPVATFETGLDFTLGIG